jgi:hypothetical protein
MRSKRSGLKVLAVGLLGLAMPVFYVASVGPVAWLVCNNGSMDLGAYNAVYGPIDSIERACPPVSKCLDAYRHLFVDEDEWLIRRLIWINEDAFTRPLPNP